jgi:hypothetical protein
MDNEFVDRAQLDAEREAKAAAKKKEEKKKKVRKTRSKKKSKGPSAFVQILNGDFLKKEFVLGNLPFIFFLILLLILVVGKGYYGKQLSSNVDKKQKELDEVTGEYFEAKARLEENTQRSILIEKLENTGLKETVNPTKVIRIEKDDKKSE